MNPLVVLGPQGEEPNLKTALDRLAVDGPVAAVTAGWQERADEIEDLGEHIGYRVDRLQLYERAEDVFERDRELFEAYRARQQELRRLQAIYRLRLSLQMEAARRLLAREETGRLIVLERQDAIDAVRRLDRHHLRRLGAIHSEFETRWRPAARPAVQRHRREIAGLLRKVRALLVAGGHVAVLLNRMRLFSLFPLPLRLPVVAWSAGAMALAERVVLFHDFPPQGAGDAEILDTGLGFFRGLVPLPHARTRLNLRNPIRVALFSNRFAPDLCVPLDAGGFVRRTRSGWVGEPGGYALAAGGGLEALPCR